jgi:hypothetical protein
VASSPESRFKSTTAAVADTNRPKILCCILTENLSENATYAGDT